MKKLIILVILNFGFLSVNAQHYGGINFTPYAVENFHSFHRSYTNFNLDNNKATYGYALGYQGLIMPQRRFSFSYGLLYTYAYNEATYSNSIPVDGPITKRETGVRSDIQALQVPLWWRYNILKNKKWQPFIALSTTVNYALKSQNRVFYDDGSARTSEINEGFFFSIDLGVGVNYTVDDWMFTVQPTIGGNYFRQLGVGFSVLKKF